jgi:hypothetical protein
VCWGGVDRGWFHSRLVSWVGCGVGSEILLEQLQLTFSFRNRFIILLPCGFLLDNNTFSKMCVFKSLTSYTDCGCYENRNAHFLIIIKSKVMKSLCLLF